jgi:hypothetical protein
MGHCIISILNFSYIFALNFVDEFNNQYIVWSSTNSTNNYIVYWMRSKIFNFNISVTAHDKILRVCWLYSCTDNTEFEYDVTNWFKILWYILIFFICNYNNTFLYSNKLESYTNLYTYALLKFVREWEENSICHTGFYGRCI